MARSDAPMSEAAPVIADDWVYSASNDAAVYANPSSLCAPVVIDQCFLNNARERALHLQ